MSKNRSTWSTLLAVVLAMVVMAGLAVTSLAVTDGDAGNDTIPVVDSVDELTAVLDGTAQPDPVVNYDVDGNGIIEWDDLDALNGTLEDLLPNGKTDIICLPLDPMYTEPSEQLALQSLYVRGDSAVAIKFDTDSRNELLDWAEPQDFSDSTFLTFDVFWPGNVGSLNVRLFCGANAEIQHVIPVQTMRAGWSTVAVDLKTIPSADLDAVWSAQATA